MSAVNLPCAHLLERRRRLMGHGARFCPGPISLMIFVIGHDKDPGDMTAGEGAISVIPWGLCMPSIIGR